MPSKPLKMLMIFSCRQDIGKLMSLAANAVSELSKSKPSPEIVEYTTKDFVKTLDVS